MLSLADFDASNDPLQGQVSAIMAAFASGVDLRASANMFGCVVHRRWCARRNGTIFILAPSSKVKISAGPSGFVLSGGF